MSKQQFIQELTLNFNLRQPKADKPTSIFAVVYIKGKQYRFSTGVKVYPHQWNKKKQEAYISLQLTELDNYNNGICNETLTKFKENFTLFRHEVCTNISRINDIINILKKHLKMKKNKQKQTGISPIYWMKSQINDNDVYRSAFKQFEDWLIETGKNLKEWDQLTYELIKEFSDYQKKSQGASRYNGIMFVLRKGISAAYKDKTIPFKDHDVIELLKECQVSTRVNDDGKVALTPEQVNYIYSMSIEDKITEEVRDMFIFECLTSLRFSNITGADFSMHKGKDTFEVVQKKEKGSKNQNIVLALDSRIKDILDKYNWTFPTFDNKKANYHIKKIVGLTPFGNEYIDVKKKLANGKTEIQKKMMKEIVGSHTARRTFITIYRSNSNVQDRDLMHLTGHQSIDMLERYDKPNKATAIQNIIQAQNCNASKSYKSSVTNIDEVNSQQDVNVLDELFDYTNLLSLCKLCANIKGEEDGSTKGIMTSPTTIKTMEKILDFTSISKVQNKLDQIDTDILTSLLKRMIPFFNVFNQYYPGTTKAVFAKARILGIELECHLD